MTTMLRKGSISEESRGVSWRRPEGGFSLIEVIVALAIMAMLMLSVAQLFLLSNHVTRYVQEVSRLTDVAQYQMEQLRSLYLNSSFTPPELENNSEALKPADVKQLTVEEFREMMQTRHACLMMWTSRDVAAENAGNLRVTEPFYYDDDPARAEAILNAQGKGYPIMAWVYWWARPVGFGDLVEVQLHVDSGARNLLGATGYNSMPLMGNASVRKTIYLSGGEFF